MNSQVQLALNLFLRLQDLRKQPRHLLRLLSSISHPGSIELPLSPAADGQQEDQAKDKQTVAKKKDIRTIDGVWPSL